MTDNGPVAITLTRDEILQFDDFEYTYEPVPEWTPRGQAEPVLARIRSLSADEASAYQKSISKVKRNPQTGQVETELDLSEMKVRLVALSLCDAQGKRLFTDDELRLLGRKSERAIHRLFEACTKFSRVGPEGVEEAVKPSAAIPSADSSSASASSSA